MLFKKTKTGWLALVLSVALAGCSGDRPADMGVHQGRLKPCPETPNCVSSFDTDEEHHVEPLIFSPGPKEVFKRIHRALEKMERVRIVKEADNYLYAEFTSLLFRFVDDVEFYLDTSTGTLHFRSASRIGRSDLGVNRERIETIKSYLAKPEKNKTH